MIEDKSEILIIEESWQQIADLSKDNISLQQIAFEIGVNYETIKKHVLKIALEKQAIGGNVTAVQTQIKLNDATEFEAIKKRVWEL